MTWLNERVMRAMALRALGVVALWVLTVLTIIVAAFMLSRWEP